MAKHHTREQYCANLAALARKAFEQHIITHESADRWVLFHRAPDGQLSSNHCAEIVVLRWGALLVHGDVDTVVFERCSDPTPDRVVRWIGRHDPGNCYRYLQEKAGKATGRASVETLDDRVARADLLGEIRQLRADGASRTETEPYRDALRALGDGEHVEMVRHELWRYAREVDLEWLARLGRVVDARVVYAHAACARLVHLLDARAGVAEAHHG